MEDTREAVLPPLTEIAAAAAATGASDIGMMKMEFNLTQDQIANLEELKKEAGLASNKELFNNAIEMLQWAVRQTKEGCTVASINALQTSYRELSVPFLDALKPGATIAVAEPEADTPPDDEGKSDAQSV